MGIRISPPLMMAAALLANAGSVHALTFEDIAGAKVEFTQVIDRVIRVNDKTKPQRAVQTTHLDIGADQRIAGRFVLTVTGERKGETTTQSRTFTYAAKLGAPFAFRDGQRIWLFENNSLVSLRTMGEGGAKLVIGFSNEGGVLKCKINHNYAREEGVSSITSKSTFSGMDVEIVSSKVVSSSCRVSK